MYSSSSDERPIGDKYAIHEYDDEGYIIDDDGDHEELMKKSQIQREQILAKRLEMQHMRHDRAHAEQVLAERKRKEKQCLTVSISDDEDSSDNRPIGGDVSDDDRPIGGDVNEADPAPADLIENEITPDDKPFDGESSSDDKPIGGAAIDQSWPAEVEEYIKKKEKSSDSMSFEMEDDIKEEEEWSLTLADMRSVQIKRSALEKVYRQPYFGDYVAGLYCRLNIGSVNSRAKYRLCKIKGVKMGSKMYNFVSSHPATNILLKLEHPRGSSTFEMKVISNSPITKEEFSSWYKMVENPPNRVDLEETLRYAEKTRLKFRHTHASLLKLMEERSFLPDVSHVSNLTQEKIRIGRAIETASSRGDAQRVQFLQKRMRQATLEQSKRQQKRMQTQMINIPMVNAELRKKNSRKDVWLKPQTVNKKKSDHTNRNLLKPSIETFGKKRKEEVLKNETWKAEVAARREKSKRRKKTRRQSQRKMKPKPQTIISEKVSKGGLPKDDVWRILSEVSKSIKFPQKAEPRYKRPETWLGTVNSNPTYFAFEYLQKPSNMINTFTLESYLRNFPLV